MASRKIVTADTMTLAAQNSDVSQAGGAAKHCIVLYWTPGVTGNILTIKIFMRPRTNSDDATFIQEMTWSSAAGTHTRTLDDYQFTATGTTEVGLFITVEQAFDEVRISYAEDSTGGAGKGTLTAYHSYAN